MIMDFACISFFTCDVQDNKFMAKYVWDSQSVKDELWLA